MRYYAISITFGNNNRTDQLTDPTYFLKIESPSQIMTCIKVLKARSKEKENLERTAGITIEININITQSTCNLKFSVAIYIYYTEEKHNALRLLQMVQITLLVKSFSL